MLIFNSLNSLFKILDKKKRIEISAISVVFVCVALLEMLGLTILFLYIGLVSNNLSDHRITAFVNRHYDTLFTDFTHLGAIQCGVVVVLFFLIKNMAVIGIDHVHRRFILSAKKETLFEIYSSFLSMPYDRVRRVSYEYLYKKIEDTDRIFNLNFLSILPFISSIIVGLLIIALLLFVNLWLTIIFSMLFGCLSIYINRKNVSQLAIKSQDRRDSQFVINKLAREAKEGFLEISVYQAQSYILKLFDKACEKNSRTHLYMGRLHNTPYALNEFVLSAALIITIIYFVLLEKDLSKITPTLSVFALAGIRLVRLFSKSSQLYQKLIQSEGDLNVFIEDMSDLKIKQTNQRSAKKEQVTTGGNITFEKHIEVKKLHYKIPERDNYLINDISLVINKGELLCIVGSSGSGKSTLALLLAGLIEPDYGAIESDGVNIYDHTLSWQDKISLVTTSSYIFPQSIRKNVAYGIEDDAIDDDRVWSCLKETSIDTFVQSLPLGLDTELPALGDELSSGQKQRICIARGLYKEPDIIILDEATSSIDLETEAKIIDNLMSSENNYTVICISHRSETCSRADQIVSMDS